MSGTAVDVVPKQAIWLRLTAVVGGYLALVVLGLLLAFPALFGEMLVRQLAARALNAPWGPFGAEDPEGKTWNVLFGMLLGLPVLAGSVVVARVVRRRLGAGGKAVALHYVFSLALLIIPILVIRIALFE